MFRKIISLIICISFLITQTGFAQAAAVELNLSGYFARMSSNLATQDTFRPIHLRYFSYDTTNNSFKVLIDKGDLEKGQLSQGLSPYSAISKQAKGTVPKREQPVLSQDLKEQTK